MRLLPEDKLIWSPVVANSRMNRERNASGVNSYEQEFRFKPEIFLEEKIREFGKASWLDLCCGYGNALNQAAAYFHTKNLQDRIRFKGVDLVDTFATLPFATDIIEFESRSVTDFSSQEKFDLVTCVHGLHYLGDKLKVIAQAVRSLNKSGLFVANFDINSIIIQGVATNSVLKKLFKEQGLNYNVRTKILKKANAAEIDFGFRYVGADDTSGPNYTGQEAVTSYYTI
jgi:SAM-dependent methyltransferase